MNSKNRNKIIVLAALLAVAVFLVLRPLFTESEFDRQYRENVAKSVQSGGTSAAAPASGQPAATPAAAGAPAVRSQFQRSAVDVDQLIASIKEIEFNYDEERIEANPMTPLVGPTAPAAIASAQGPGATAPPGVMAAASDPQGVLRNFKVTGIVWDKYDPMAVVTFPSQGALTNEVVSRGFTFPGTEITVTDIQQDRVVLNAKGAQVTLQLEER